MPRDKLLALLNFSQSLAARSQSLSAVLTELTHQLGILLPGTCGYLVLPLAKSRRLKVQAYGGARSTRSGDLSELLRKAATVGGTKVSVSRVDPAKNSGFLKGSCLLAVVPIRKGSTRLGHIVSGFRTAKDAERTTELLKAVSELAGVHLVNAQEREAATTKCRYLSEHDVLVTNLPNRRLFRQRARKAFEAGAAAIVFLDLDGFNLVNRDFGYACGDEVLKVVARRWRKIVNETWRGATLARVGGDEFAVLLADQNIEKAKALANTLLGALREPIGNANAAPIPRASAGISRLLPDGANIDEVLRRAEAAMFLAKAAGGDRCVVATQKAARSKERNTNG